MAAMSFVTGLRVLLWSAVALFVAVPSSAGSTRRLPRQEEEDHSHRPCGYIFDVIKAEVENATFPVLWAKDVYDCLITVPFHQAVALRFLDYYTTTIEFHSTLAYLKFPTPEYQQPPVDVLGELAKIRTNVEANQYANQYEFEVAVQKVVLAMHDTHAQLVAGILAPFTFASPIDIVAASPDGKALPRPYLKFDVIKARDAGFSWEPSPIATINGIDAVEYLTEFAANQSFGNLEPHADWNDLMESPSIDLHGIWATFGGQVTFYPGDEITMTLANSSTVSSRWLALLNDLHNPGALETGGDFFNYFVLNLLPASHNTTSFNFPVFEEFVSETPPTDADLENGNWFNETYGAYPANPDVRQYGLSVVGGGVVSGYYLRDISTGVLSIPSFDQFSDEFANFSSAVQEFIDGASSEGLKRVIIDVQQNTGGAVNLAFDTFRRFFPQTEPFDGSRRRSHANADTIGHVITEWWKEVITRLGNGDIDEDNFDEALNVLEETGNEWVIAPRIDAATGEYFGSWADYSPSVTYRGDAFSKIERYNLSDEAFVFSAFSSNFPYGYGENPTTTKQPWKADEIVILTDGLCASTCAMFVEFMKQAGVRTIVAGGRPETGPMQAAAGTRGARGYSGDMLDWIFAAAGALNETANRTLPAIPPNAETRDTGMWTHWASFNLRDQIRSEDVTDGEEPIPLQFEYEAADCRIFYTVENIYNMTRLWSDAAAAAFDDTSLCVEDSTGYASSPGAPAPLPPPTRAPIHVPSSVIALGASGAGAEGSGNNTGPDLNEGDIVAGFNVIKRDPIQECGAGGVCKPNFKCRTIPIKCASGRAPSRPTANFCVPMCAGQTQDRTCARFSTDQRASTRPLQCRYESSFETKLRDTDEPRSREGYIGFCQPPDGISVGKFCPAAPAAARPA